MYIKGMVYFIYGKKEQLVCSQIYESTIHVLIDPRPYLMFSEVNAVVDKKKTHLLYQVNQTLRD